MTVKSLRRCLLTSTVAGIAACGSDHPPAGPDLTLAAAIAVSPDSLRLMINDTARVRAAVLNVAGDTLPDAPVSFLSSDTTVATIDANGLVQARAGGVSDVEVRSDTITTILRVRVRVNGTLVVSPRVSFLEEADSVQLSVVVQDSTGAVQLYEPVQYRSEDTSVARVSANGLVKFGGAAGSVMIHVSSVGRTDGAFITAVVGRVPSGGGDLVRVRGNIALTLARDFNASVQRVDLVTGSVTDVGTFATQGYVSDFAVNHALTRAYLADARQVLTLDLIADTIGAMGIAPAQLGPYDLVLGPGDSVLFFTADSLLYRMNLRTRAVTPAVICQRYFTTMVANDSMLYGHCFNDSDIELREYNMRTNSPGRVLRRGRGVEGLALSADGTHLYLSGYQGLAILDLVTGDSIATVPVPANGYGPGAIAVQPTTGLVWFVSSFAGRVYAVDPSARRLARTLQPGGNPAAIGFGSNGTGIIANPNSTLGNWIDLIR